MFVSHQMMMANYDETLRRAARDQMAATARRARREAAARRRQAQQPATATGRRLVSVLFPRAAA